MLLVALRCIIPLGVQAIASLPRTGCHGLPVSPEDPSLGSLHRTGGQDRHDFKNFPMKSASFPPLLLSALLHSPPPKTIPVFPHFLYPNLLSSCASPHRLTILVTGWYTVPCIECFLSPSHRHSTTPRSETTSQQQGLLNFHLITGYDSYRRSSSQSVSAANENKYSRSGHTG